MIPLIIQLAATLAALPFASWRLAARIGMVALFVFTGLSHFSRLKRGMAAMVPPPFTGVLWVIYLTGVLELAGVVGLLMPAVSQIAAWGLIALLLAMFPANVYAALRNVTLAGRTATPLVYRTPLQIFWIGTLWWSTVQSG